MTGEQIQERRAARLLVVDPAGSVLLFEYEDHRGRWWATPGGGVEESESFEAAAVREAREELGITAPALVPAWDAAAVYESRGRTIRQSERFFLLYQRREGFLLESRVAEEHRREGILSLRWWSLEEIATTRERLFPEDLGARLRAVVDEAPGGDQ